MELLYPAGTGLSKTAVGAGEDLELGPQVKVFDVAGAAGTITSAGGSGRETQIAEQSIRTSRSTTSPRHSSSTA